MGDYLAKSANMMRHTANKPAPPALGIFSPLRYAVFRRIWTASPLSNLGLLVLGVGAAWAMTKISSSTGMVALVQTSLMLPVALVSTPVGAIADMFDRRIVLLVALSIALAGSISLSVLAWLGVMTPALLLSLASSSAVEWPCSDRPGRRLSANKCQQRRCPRLSRSMASVTTLPAALGPRSAAS
jgi:MFS family permease